MRIAVAYEDDMVFQHFGKTEHFKLYDVQEEKIEKTSILDAKGNGHNALAGLLQQNGVNVLICGGIGTGAKQLLLEASIPLYPGVVGKTDDAVAQLLDGKLIFDPNADCNHHGEHHHENADGHHCGGGCDGTH